MRPRLGLVVAAALVLFAAQLWLIGHFELTFDEAYYTLWSRSLAWGYLDHPPMAAFWIRASTVLFGGSEFGVRFFNLLAFAATPALAALIAWRLFASRETASWAALLWLSTPLLAGAPIVTPDSPLVIFGGLTLAALVEVWRGRAWAWAAVGLAMGLALLSKFTAIFLGAGIALAILGVPSLRRHWFSPAPYLAALLALGVEAPFLVWNAAHGWATFAKQFGRVSPRGLAPGYVLEFLGSQFALLNPAAAILAGAGAAGAFAAPVDRAGEARRLLLASVAPAILYFLVHALHDRVQGNWLAPLYLPLIILAADVATRGPAWARRLARLAPPLGFAAIALAYLHAVTAWPALGPSDPLARVGGWRDLTREIDERAQSEGAAFVLARGYSATSLLTYYGDPRLTIVQAEEPERWIFQPAPDPALLTKPGLALGDANRDFAAQLRQRFAVVEEIARPRRMFGAVVAQEFALFRVSGPR